MRSMLCCWNDQAVPLVRSVCRVARVLWRSCQLAQLRNLHPGFSRSTQRQRCSTRAPGSCPGQLAHSELHIIDRMCLSMHQEEDEPLSSGAVRLQRLEAKPPAAAGAALAVGAVLAAGAYVAATTLVPGLDKVVKAARAVKNKIDTAKTVARASCVCLQSLTLVCHVRSTMPPANWLVDWSLRRRQSKR